MKAIPVPERIHRDDRQVTITWPGEHVSHYPARALRLQCHCAVCRDELTSRPLLDPTTVAHDVKPLAISLVGSYAIRIDWSDGHNAGIYTYEHLLTICPCERCAADRGSGGPTDSLPG